MGRTLSSCPIQLNAALPCAFLNNNYTLHAHNISKIHDTKLTVSEKNAQCNNKEEKKEITVFAIVFWPVTSSRVSVCVGYCRVLHPKVAGHLPLITSPWGVCHSFRTVCIKCQRSVDAPLENLMISNPVQGPLICLHFYLVLSMRVGEFDAPNWVDDE